jgi:phosphoglycerate kinase
MPDFRTLDDLEVAGRRVLVRVDFNVPMQDGRVTDATRIERGSPTLKELADKGARVIVLSHLGRPKGKVESSMSLRPLQEPMAKVLGREVAFAEDCIGEVAEQAAGELADGGVLLLENLRFHAGEERNDPGFADSLARLGEVYVNDAFSAAHRAHASITGLALRLPAAAGRLMQAELEALERVLESPERPVAAIIGGAKISTKVDVLGHLTSRVDLMVIGGGMANTFLNAKGVKVGKSLCEHDLADTARGILKDAEARGCEILLPTDARVAKELREGAASREVALAEVEDDDMILDIGPATTAEISRRLAGCRSLVWNGPLGAFEIPPFDAGTNEVARKVAELTDSGRLASVAGGGDTLSALAHAGVLDRLTYCSTAGGAFLEWLEGKELPGVEALRVG